MPLANCNSIDLRQPGITHNYTLTCIFFRGKAIRYNQKHSLCIFTANFIRRVIISKHKDTTTTIVARV